MRKLTSCVILTVTLVRGILICLKLFFKLSCFSQSVWNKDILWFLWYWSRFGFLCNSCGQSLHYCPQHTEPLLTSQNMTPLHVCGRGPKRSLNWWQPGDCSRNWEPLWSPRDTSDSPEVHGPDEHEEIKPGPLLGKELLLCESHQAVQ